jgi:hypothetical protein
MKLFDICTRQIYENEGVKKVKWYKAGVLKETDTGKKYIRFFHQPQTEFFVFNKESADAQASLEKENNEEVNQK